MHAYTFIGQRKWLIILGEIEAGRSVELAGRENGVYAQFNACVDKSVISIMKRMPVTFALRMEVDVDPKYLRRRQSIIGQEQ